jgi:cell division protein ZapA (FtsZ GTPase activity inhibitor)
VKQFLPEKYSIDNEGDLLFCAFVGDKLVHDAYVHEQEQVIQFIMMAVQNSILMDHNKKKEFMKFLHTKQDVLHALGIGIQLPTKGPLDQRWDQIQQQIQELSQEELGVFNQLKALYEAERGQSKLDGAAAREEQRRQQEERARQAEENQRQKDEQLAELQKKIEEMAASGAGA